MSLKRKKEVEDNHNDKVEELINDDNNQQQQQLIPNNNIDSTLQELSFKVQLPKDFVFSEFVPQFPQAGRYAFPAGLANERSLFGWPMKSDGSHSNAAGNQRIRHYRCCLTFLQCNKCLKVVDDKDVSSAKQKSNNRKIVIKTETNISNNEERKCIDSPRCDGVLLLKNCDVISNLIIEPFLAKLEVSANHLHAHPQKPDQQKQTQSKSVQIRSVNIDEAIASKVIINENDVQKTTTTIDEKEANLERKAKKSKTTSANKSLPLSSSSTTTKPSVEIITNTIISSAISNAINWSLEAQRHAFLQAELAALSSFSDIVSSSTTTIDHSTLVERVRCELLYVAFALAKSQLDASYWRQHVSTVMRERASVYARFPWFAALIGGVLCVIQQNQLIFTDDNNNNNNNDDDNNNSEHNYTQLLVERLLKASDNVSMSSVLAMIDVSLVDEKTTRPTLRFISAELAERLAFPSQRRVAIQKQLSSVVSLSTTIPSLSSSLNDVATILSTLSSTTTTTKSEPTITVNDVTINNSANTSTSLRQSSLMEPKTTSVQVNSLIASCERLSVKYNDMKTFLPVSEQFIALFLNAVAAECRQLDGITRTRQPIQFSSKFNVSASTGITHQLSTLDFNDWLGALAMGCETEVTDDARLELRLMALVELTVNRQFYVESIGGVRFLCDMVDDLVGDNWQASLRNESLILFANIWKVPIVIIDLQRKNKEPIVALPLCQSAIDCNASSGSLLGRSMNGKFHLLRQQNQQRNNFQQQQTTTRATALLPSINCVSLAQPFIKHYSASISIIINNNDQYSYSTTTTMASDGQNNNSLRLFNLLWYSDNVGSDDDDDIVLNDSSLDQACQVHVRDLRRLLTGQWLNDELVNALIALAIRSETAQGDAFPSSITQKLTQPNEDWIDRYHSFNGRTFQQLLLEKISILIPWHTAGHWSLLWINPTTKEIRHINSLRGSKTIPNKHLAERLFKLININKYKLICNIQSPIQKDIVNCGAFVVLNAWRLANQQTLSSQQQYFTDSTLMRQALARTIINSSSDWPL